MSITLTLKFSKRSIFIRKQKIQTVALVEQLVVF